MLSSQSSQIELKQVLLNSSAIRAKEGILGVPQLPMKILSDSIFIFASSSKGKISGPGGAAEIAKNASGIH